MFCLVLGLMCSYVQLVAPLALGRFLYASSSNMNRLMIYAGRPFPLINQSLDEITIDELNTFFENGSLTSVELVQVRQSILVYLECKVDQGRLISKGHPKSIIYCTPLVSLILMFWRLRVRTIMNVQWDAFEGE